MENLRIYLCGQEDFKDISYILKKSFNIRGLCHGKEEANVEKPRNSS